MKPIVISTATPKNGPRQARRPTIAPTLPDAPASALKTMIRTSPDSSVRLAPIRLATTLEASIEIPVKAN
jgi:hypothetical protein